MCACVRVACGALCVVHVYSARVCGTRVWGV